MTEAKVILFCPVRVSLNQLDATLASHLCLQGVSERWYYDDNDQPGSSARLQQEARNYSNVRILPRLTVAPPESTEGRTQPDGSHTWTPDLISRISLIRNQAIDLFLCRPEDSATHMFTIDADIICNPDMVTHLAAGGLDIVSEVFWSKWNPTEPWRPNVWDYHNYGFHTADSITRLRTPGVYQVGGLGACTLISRRVFEAGVNYLPIPGQAMFPGEDRSFCTRASSAGFKLWADTHYPPYHVYRPEQFEEMLGWGMAGYSPEYFREVWLTDQWATDTQRATKGPRHVALMLPGETYSSPWVSHYTSLIMGMIATGLIPCGPLFGYSPNVYITRAAMADALLKNYVEPGLPTPEFVLWMDDDNLLTPEQLHMLIADLDAYPNLAGVAGWCLISTNGYDTGERFISAGEITAEGKSRPYTLDRVKSTQGLLGVDWTGFPVFLIRYEALSRLGPEGFVPILSPKYQWGFSGEDLAWCIRAGQAGMELAIDPRVRVPHLKLRDTSEEQAPSLIPVRMATPEAPEPPTEVPEAPITEPDAPVAPVEAPVEAPEEDPDRPAPAPLAEPVGVGWAPYDIS